MQIKQRKQTMRMDNLPSPLKFMGNIEVLLATCLYGEIHAECYVWIRSLIDAN